MTLHELGVKYRTDKATHLQNDISFLHKYEPYLSSKRDLKNNIFEIGVLNGSSHRTWEAYFKNSNIIGLDINPSAKINESGRIDIFIGSQDDKKIRDQIKEK